MANPRNRGADLMALCLLIVAIFMILSLSSYRVGDPIGEPVFPFNRFYRPDLVTYPQAEDVGNHCGHAGAVAADMLLRGFGWGAYYLVISVIVLAITLLSQRTVAAPLLRLVGWITSLIALCGLASLILTHSWSGPVIGPGGYLGALGQSILAEHFGSIGSGLLSAGALMLGLLLCTDYVLLQFAAVTATAAANKTIRRGQRTVAANDLDDDPLPVRNRGKRALTASDAEEETEEDDEEFEEEDEYEGEEDDQPLEEDEEDDIEDEVEETPAVAARGLRGLIQRAAPKKNSRSAEKDNERQEVIEQLEEASRHEEAREYDLPSIELLHETEEFCFDEQNKEVRRKAKVLEKTFQDFGFNVKVVEIETGPVIAQYEIELEAGLRLSKITGLADDLAIALRVPSVRIVAPIPGKNTVGIEVPNEQRQTVRLREVMEESIARAKKMRIPLFFGKDVSGNPLVADLSTLPHLLIAGRTGTGKSVCLNAIISSILMTRRPDEVRMLMIDPKMVELSGYKTLPHLMHPVVTDMRKAEAILAWAVDKMEERYSLLAQAGVRHISAYNQLGEEELMDRLQPDDDDARAAIPLHLPYIVIVADEMADLMMTSGKEVEQHIIRLAQKSRAVGIHLILATQKPTVDVITGLIKSNLPARIAFQVASRTDSRVVLDEMGADKLLGNGDMLFLWPGTSTLLRGQGTYLGDDEINSVVEFVSTGEQDFVNELVQLKVEEAGEGTPGQLKKRDDLYESAVDIVVREGRGSVSLLQRCLGIGYGRAARLIDFMAEDGIVGSYNGSQAREVVISVADWEAMQQGEAAPDAPAKPTPKPARPPAASPPAARKQTPADEVSDDLEEEDEDEYEDEYEDEDEGEETDAPADEEAEEDETEDGSEYEDEEVDEYDGEEYEDDEYEYEEDLGESEPGDEEYEDEVQEYDEEDEDYDDEEYEVEEDAAAASKAERT